MTLQQMRYFIGAAESGSISEAAKRSFTAQSSISGAIKEVENTYGITAFVRDSKGVRLTRSGEELLIEFKGILNRLDYLDEKGLSDNTLVVYTSDQGFYMGEHGWFDKRFMYEESMHTPLIMRLPRGLNKRGDIPQLVQNIDYAPTFLELAGVSVPEDMQGVSLVPLLKGESPDDWRHSLYYHFYEYPAEHAVKRHYGVRTERYKLIHFYNDIDVWELYDLKEDPSEMNNLYGRESTEEITRQLKDELKTLQQQYGAPISL